MKEVLVAALLWATPIATTSTSGSTLISITKEKKESRTTTKKKKERKEKTPGKKETIQLADPTISQ